MMSLAILFHLLCAQGMLMGVLEKFHICNIMKLGNQTRENVLQIRTF